MKQIISLLSIRSHIRITILAVFFLLLGISSSSYCDTWTQVNQDGFGDPNNNDNDSRGIVFNGYINIMDGAVPVENRLHRPKGISCKHVDNSTKAKVQNGYGNLPLYFIQNNGQIDEKVKYYEKGMNHSTFFTQEGVYLSIINKRYKHAHTHSRFVNINATKQEMPAEEFLKLTFLDANKNPVIMAEDIQEGKVNYFIGNDPEKWKANIPTYKIVLYKDIYKGIDMKFYGNSRSLEYDVVVNPGADPSQVKFSYEGIRGMRISDEGNLEISLNRGKLIHKMPYIYQEIDGKRQEIKGSFVIQELTTEDTITANGSKEQQTYGFHVASYDKRYALIIDPVLAYSTYLGGSSGEENGLGIAVDNSGNVYVTGHTASIDFPVANAIQDTYGGGANDIFITKINADGSGLIYSTYLGGSGFDEPWGGIVVDTAGNAYIGGSTSSVDFPTFNAIQPNYGGGGLDAIVTKINPSGSALVYSTYLGGDNIEDGNSISVDNLGNAYIAGKTASNNFPIVNAIQALNGGGFDAFVAKINPAGSALVYSTFLGGGLDDESDGVSVDNSGNAYVIGETSSTDFPIVNAIQPNYGGGVEDAFVLKINPTGSALVYSTFLGGSGFENGEGSAVDSFGNAYIVGRTDSIDFPIVNAIQPNYGGGVEDVFVTKINPAGSAIVYSTYLGGSGSDDCEHIAVDNSGSAYITGETSSINFPIINAIQPNYGGGAEDAFVSKINPSGSVLVYSTYLGGSGSDGCDAIAVDRFGNAFIIGDTDSTDFPTTTGAFDTSYNGNRDAFVVRLGTTAFSYDIDRLTQVGGASGSETFIDKFDDDIEPPSGPSGPSTYFSTPLSANAEGGGFLNLNSNDAIIGDDPSKDIVTSLTDNTYFFNSGSGGRLEGKFRFINGFETNSGFIITIHDTPLSSLESTSLIIKKESSGHIVAFFDNWLSDTDTAIISQIDITDLLGTSTDITLRLDISTANVVTASLDIGSDGSFDVVMPGSYTLTFPGGTKHTGSFQAFVETANLVFAVLPSSRSVQVGTPATAFMTILNAGTTTSNQVVISLSTSIPASLSFQTTDTATNAVTGIPNTPVDILAGGIQSFVIAITPTASFVPTTVEFNFAGTNTLPVGTIQDVNTLLFSASDTPIPDIVALVATINNDGIVNIPGSTGTGVFSVATVNVGAGEMITASADTGAAGLPLNISICETDPTTGICLSTPSSSVTTQIDTNATPTFGIFVEGTGDVPFDPATNRIFVRFNDSNALTRGSTGVAVRTTP